MKRLIVGFCTAVLLLTLLMATALAWEADKVIFSNFSNYDSASNTFSFTMTVKCKSGEDQVWSSYVTGSVLGGKWECSEDGESFVELSNWYSNFEIGKYYRFTFKLTFQAGNSISEDASTDIQGLSGASAVVSQEDQAWYATITLPAIQPPVFTVTFDADGGTPAPSSQSVASGGTVTKPDDPTKEGYSFLGWHKGDNAWDFDNDTVTAALTLKAKWAQLYTITFNANGGTPAPSSQSVASGGKVTKPDDPTKEGYSFLGWYNGDNAWDFDNDTVTAALTLKAKWAQLYTVTFDANGGTPAPSSQSIASGGKVTKPDDPTKEGYSFLGWYNGDTPWDFDNNTVTAALTLKAKWAQLYTVTFNVKGGTPTPSSQSVASGGTVTKPDDPTKEGYSFLGWYDDDGELWHFDKDTVTAALTLTAGWAQLYTVTFDANGGAPAPSSQSVASGRKVTKPATDPTKEGCSFLGWYDDFDKLWDFDNDTVTANLTLTAKWQEISEEVPTPQEDVKLSSFKVGKAGKKYNLSGKTLQLKKGKVQRLHVFGFKPRNASNLKVRWCSSNTAVCTVKQGKLVAKKAGTAKITVTARDGSGVSASFTVEVK